MRVKLMRPRSIVLTATLLSLLCATDMAVSEPRRAPDTFTATTTDMTPAGVMLKIDVLEWSDESARDAVVTALSDGAGGSLAESPTIGYVWVSGSAVGYAVKYAHRTPSSGGGERITFVTAPPVGSYSFKPWAANGEPAPKEVDYSVVELYLDDEGLGVGTLSLAANVVLDDDSETVSLAGSDSAPNVLTGAKREPKPYWAKGS